MASKTYDKFNKEDILMKKYDALTQKILKKFTTKNSKILDLGCGTGFVLDAINDIYRRYTGLDFSVGMLKVAKVKFKSKIKTGKVKFINYDLNNKLPFKNNSFDFVCSLYASLSYVKNIKLAINEAYRVCKKGGFIYIGMLNRYSLCRLLKFRYGSKEYYKSKTHEGEKISSLVYFYTPKEILNMLPKTSKYRLMLLKSQMILLDINWVYKLFSNKKSKIDSIMDFEENFNTSFPFTLLGHGFVIVIKKT